MSHPLKIVIVEQHKERAEEVTEALCHGGWADVAIISDDSHLAAALSEHDPDIVLIDLSNPRRDTLEALSEVSGAHQRPVAMFVDQSNPELSAAAVRAGLSAYVVGGLSGDRIRPILETAIARFRMMSQMQSELEAAKQALENRKTIDRAKGLLIRAKGLSEEEAYQLMRKSAMDQGKRMIDVAQALITAAELLR
ncbi:ANTAR domain-containing response regulator [Aliiroseovarius marinus]|uniref:ANTAR domain-containing response regulator n=1 Tax=Aliiroseovarius marinus TaxID=2500159 RepID=UPI00105D7BF5|nr:ANTAR domain-containing protein [Aliiroseovarius marinus]